MNTKPDGNEHKTKETMERLSDPGAYPHRPAEVRLVQTHISWVALTPPWVYKVKKPLNLGFLDFSSLDKRRRCCEEEVRLNRRLCDGVYEGVVPISQRNGDLSVEDDCHTVEVAVKMAYLPEEDFLDRRLARNDVSEGDVRRVAAKLAAFYNSQTPSAKIADWGRIPKLRISTEENLEQIEPFTGTLLPGWSLEAIRRYTKDFFRTEEELFNKRRVEGRIVDGHGDLRLEHIHLNGKAIRIFDCIEFNERFRYIDVANDVAFLAMDFDVHGRPSFGTLLAKEMAGALDDPGLMRLLDFYKCYRACVRGKVQGMKSREPEVDAENRERSEKRARRFFQLALRYAALGSDSVVLVVMGRVGTGKSTISRLLGEGFGWPVFSSDQIRKRLAGVPLHVRGGASERAALYSREMTEKTYAGLMGRTLDRAREGEGTVLDATFGRRADRRRLQKLLQGEGVAYVFIELTAPDGTVRERLEAREGREDVISDAREEDRERLSDRYEHPDALEEANHFTADTAPRDPESTVEEIVKHVSRRLAIPQGTG